MSVTPSSPASSPGPSSEGVGPSSAGSSGARSGASPASSGRSADRRVGVYACVFWLGGQRYALDTVDVVEAIVVTQLVPVPLSPPWLVGLTSLRGTPLPVVELPLVLALPVPALPGETPGTGQPALVMRVDDMLLAGRVDRIEAVYSFEGARFESAAANEHPAVRGLLDAGASAVPATLLDHHELERRVGALRFRARF